MKKKDKKETSLVLPVTPEFVERRIHIVRGQKIILDKDLAELYQVSTKQLNQQVKRNIERFPSDFMFQLTNKEVEAMRFQIGTAGQKDIRSQFVTASNSRRNNRYTPYAFTELGIAMLFDAQTNDESEEECDRVCGG